MNAYMYVCLYVYIYICMYVCVYVYVYIYIFICLFKHAVLYICIHTYIYIYIYPEAGGQGSQMRNSPNTKHNMHSQPNPGSKSRGTSSVIITTPTIIRNCPSKSWLHGLVFRVQGLADGGFMVMPVDL